LPAVSHSHADVTVATVRQFEHLFDTETVTLNPRDLTIESVLLLLSTTIFFINIGGCHLKTA